MASLDDVAWLAAGGHAMTHPVGQKKPNTWGLYDLHGNVRQWCADKSEPAYYTRSPAVDPPGPDSGPNRVLRGCGWLNEPGQCSSAFRHHNEPTARSSDTGFRVICEPAGRVTRRNRSRGGAGAANTSTKRKRVGCRRARAEAPTRLRFVLVLAPAP
jgi:hypothetical protein